MKTIVQYCKILDLRMETCVYLDAEEDKRTLEKLNKYCYIRLTGVTTYEFLDILNYKSYHKKNTTIRYVDVVKAMRNGKTIIRTTIGFAPLLLQYLREKDVQYLIIDNDASKDGHRTNNS